MTTNGHPAHTSRTRNRAADGLAIIIGTAVLSPALALPLGLAWRVLTWTAGL